MTETEVLLREHMQRYPLSQPQDAVKLIYQNEFGPGHLLRSRKEALARLREELETVRPGGTRLTEHIGNGMYRLHLDALDTAGLRAETAAGLFAEACRPMGNRISFENKLACLEALSRSGGTPFSAETLTAWLGPWREAGCPQVHHSETYRRAYHPAYRVIEERSVRLLPLFAEIDRVTRERGHCVLKLDGRCASGKTTLAEFIARVYADAEGGVSLFHMDDYYMPWAQKTPERLAEPGGNVDWERFLGEVDSVPAGREIVWRPFSCGEQRLLEPRIVPAASLRIIEGAYSMHPRLPRPDLAVFVDVPAELQLRRILRRNGEDGLRGFQEKWIPLEEAYIAACLRPADFRFHLTIGEQGMPELRDPISFEKA